MQRLQYRNLVHTIIIRCSDCNSRAFPPGEPHKSGQIEDVVCVCNTHGAVLFPSMSSHPVSTVSGWRACEGSHALKSNGFFCPDSTSSSSFSVFSTAGPGLAETAAAFVLEALDSCSCCLASCRQHQRRASSATGLQSSCLSLQTICEDSSMTYLPNYPLAHDVWPLC